MPKTSPNAQAIARRAVRATRVERLTPRAYQIALIVVMCLPAYGEASAKDMKLVVRKEYMRRNPECGFVISLVIGLCINLIVQWIIKWISKTLV